MQPRLILSLSQEQKETSWPGVLLAVKMVVLIGPLRWLGQSQPSTTNHQHSRGRWCRNPGPPNATNASNVQPTSACNIHSKSRDGRLSCPHPVSGSNPSWSRRPLRRLGLGLEALHVSLVAGARSSAIGISAINAAADASVWTPNA